MYSSALEILNLNDDGFHLLVEVVIFGKVFKAVVDTGASRTVLDQTSIREHIAIEDLLVSDKLSTGLGTNSMESHTLIVPSFQIGHLLITDFEMAVLDLGMINNAYESLEIEPIIGVIGGDILMEYRATINYSTKNMTLRKPVQRRKKKK